MTDRAELRVNVTATDNASDEFQRIGRNAQAMGRDIDRAADTAQKGFRGVGDSAERMARDVDVADRSMDRFSKTGAALGAVVGTLGGVLSDFARAAAEEEAIFGRLEAAVDATGESFDELSPSIDEAIAAAEELSFADDQAATALTNLTTITGSAQEAMDLMALAMDVARGRGISLAEAATLVGRAAEGQTAALTRMGIVLQEGATAQDALNELQRRYANQAETYASTTQGAIDRLKNSFDNWAESVGSSTGEIQTVLTLLPGLSAGFSGLTTVVGGLVGLLGPVGLVAAAAAAASVAIGYLVYNERRHQEEAQDAAEATDELTDALNRLAGQSDTMSEQFVTGQRWRELTQDVVEFDNVIDALFDTLTAQALAGDLGEFFDNAAEAQAYALRVQEQYGLSTEETNLVVQALSSALQYQGAQWDAVSAHVNEAIADFLSGRITADAFIARIEAIPDVALSAAGATSELADANERLARAQEDAARAAQDLAEAWATQPIDAQTAFLSIQAQAIEAITAANLTQIESTRDAVAAQAEATAAMVEAAEAGRVEAVSLDDVAAAMGSVEYASFAAIDGVVSLTEQQRLLTVQGVELAASQTEVGQQLGFYRGAVNDMEAAYEELQARLAAGESLNQDQLDFIAEYEAEADGMARTIGDLVIEQGILAQAQIDNAEAQEGLTETLAETNDVFGDLVGPMTIIAEALAAMAGLDLGNLMPPERTAVAWTEVAMAVSDARDALATMPRTTPGDASGGPAQGAAQEATGPAAGVIKLAVDASQAFDELQAVEDRAEFVMDGPGADGWTMELKGDGDDLYAEIRDAEGELVRLVTEDRTVVIDGDPTDALSDVVAVSMALADLHGQHATVYADADTSGARAEINSLLGYQGSAYVNVYAVPANNLPSYTSPYASGGIVEAANGRVVRAGEIGPELVYPPGGNPWLAARDGLYVMQPGSYVANAAATSARGGAGGITVNLTINGSVGVDDIAEQLVDLLDTSLAMAFENRYTALGMA